MPLGNKTSKSSGKKTTLLPAVVPRIGVSGLDWWTTSVEVRAVLGLPELPTLLEAAAWAADSDRTLVMPTIRKGWLHEGVALRN